MIISFIFYICINITGNKYVISSDSHLKKSDLSDLQWYPFIHRLFYDEIWYPRYLRIYHVRYHNCPNLLSFWAENPLYFYSWFLRKSWKGYSVANWSCHALNRGSIEITPTVPLSWRWNDQGLILLNWYFNEIVTWRILVVSVLPNWLFLPFLNISERMNRGFLAARSLLKVPQRGKALANWARPSIDELGVPTESWKQVFFL